MKIITLTTDLGIKDHYVALVKAAIFKELPDINIIDISHQISKFNIQEASFIFKNSYKYFPEGTIHIIGIDDELTNTNPHLAVEINNQYIIGADNGIFSLIFDEVNPDQIIKLNISQDTNDQTFAIKDIFVKAACHLARGGTLEMIGSSISDFENKRTTLKAVTEKKMIKGLITHIDSYGNATTNINKKTFNNLVQNNVFEIIYGRENEKIIKISKKYKDVDEGERLAIFTSNNLLQICINQGKACDLLGLDQFDIIRVEIK